MDRPIDRRRFVRLTGTALAVALAGCTGGDGGDEVTTQPTQTTTELPAGTTEGATQTAEETTAETTEEETTEADEESTTEAGQQGYVRAAHASPDAPAVDVYVNDSLAFEEASYASVTPYAQLPPDDYDVRVTAAGEESAVVFDETVTVEPGYQTAVAYGEAASQGSETGLAVDVFADQSEQPGGNEALVRVFNGAPDASALTVTVEETGDALVDGAAFGEPTDYVAVSPGSYALEMRPDSGDATETFDVNVEGGTAYSVLALGYAEPSGDQPELELLTTTDGTSDSP